MKKFADKTKSKVCGNCGSVFYRDKRNTYKYWEKARFCSTQCASEKTKKERLQNRKSLNEVFFGKAEIADKNECWKWNGTTDKNGYGVLVFNGKQFRANRIALILSGNAITDKQYACHLCGNNWCVNPSHIYAGTPADNSADMVIHGTRVQGEMVHCSKLSANDVCSIRNDNRVQHEIARDYGVSRTTISQIKTRRTWKHIK